MEAPDEHSLVTGPVRRLTAVGAHDRRRDGRFGPFLDRGGQARRRGRGMNRSGVRVLKATWLAARLTAPISRRLAGFFAWRLWFTPWRLALSEKAKAREAAWLEGTTPLVVPFGRGTLRGFTAGEGPTVLLVHGWGDRASRLGAFIAPLTAAGYRVAAVDLPAHGDSSGLRTNAYEAAAGIRATADHLGGVDAVIAHSMGGAETLLALREIGRA